ncbi:MAG: putative DNA modification/repair radical SAM protein [Planctomycetota bacterium]
MDVREKLDILAGAAKYDVSCASSGSNRAGSKPSRSAAKTEKPSGLGSTHRGGICHSFTPDGRCISLLKILLTNHCIYDCLYCVNRVSSDIPRTTLTVDEVVWLTTEFYRRNYIEGLFLSSGILRSPDYTMGQLAEVVRRLREEENFRGYIHVKAIPGAAQELVDLAGRHADRLSANIELPTEADLKQLAPQKDRPSIELAMQRICGRVDEAKQERRRSRRAPRFAPAGQSTQMVIGASPTPDATILATASTLYQSYRLKRVYYSAFSPVPRSAAWLPSGPPPLLREHRLYQADWLMRFYGFDAKELTTPDSANLPADFDPKLAWALRHREFFPVDLNHASREALLRVPGLGVKSVQKILRIRRVRRLRLEDLPRLGLALRRAQPFVTVDDRNPLVRMLDEPALGDYFRPPARQLTLF